MTAPDEIHIKPNDGYENKWVRPEFTDPFDEDGTEYIRADLHQSALADRDATIARLQARLDAGPTVERLRELADYCNCRYTALKIDVIVKRMEVANGK